MKIPISIEIKQGKPQNEHTQCDSIKFGIIICYVLFGILFSNEVSAQVGLGDPLPENYFFKNIGEPRGPTVFSYIDSTGTYSINHQGGNDTGWGTEDDCCMIYFETAEDKEVVARLVSLVPYNCTFNPKGFIMVRSSLEPQAAMSFLELRNDGRIIINWRPEAGFNNANSAYNHNYPLPVINQTWIKYIRQGAYVSGFYSKDGRQWTPVGAPIRLKFTGTVYMGIGAAGCCGGAKVIWDNFIVRDIVNPYRVNGDTIKALQNVVLTPQQTSTFDITTVFGHYFGDYFTVNAVSTDSTVAKAKTYLVSNPNYATAGGDLYLQKLDITGLKDGVTDIKLSSNVLGFKLSFDFLVSVNGPHTSIAITPMDPSPWILKDLGIASNPNPSQVVFKNSVNNNVSIYSNTLGGLGSDTVTALYQLFDHSHNLRLIARVDSVKNTGKGAYAGLMLRDTTTTGSPYVSFTAGAYQGLRFGYRWDYNANVTNIDDNSISLPCWIMLDYTRDAQNNTYFQPYYSYDSAYWKSLLKYQLPLNLSKNKIMAGLVVSGGSKTTTDRKSLGMISKFSVSENAFGKIHLFDSLSNAKSTMTIFPNPVSSSAPITIGYKIVQPGNAYMTVYDIYGVLKEVVFSSYMDIGDYTKTYSPVNLQPGIYLLKLISKGDYQTLKFIYQ